MPTSRMHNLIDNYSSPGMHLLSQHTILQEVTKSDR